MRGRWHRTSRTHLFLWKGEWESWIGTGSFIHKRIISVVKMTEFVSERMSYIILRGHWCDIIVLNAYVPIDEFHIAGPSLWTRQLGSCSRISPNFIEHKGLLPCLQEPSTGLYSEPDQFSPYHLILSLQDPSLYYPLTYALVFLVVSLVLTFPSIFYIHSNSVVLPVLPISSSLISSL
jgi:hypothetical protein